MMLRFVGLIVVVLSVVVLSAPAYAGNFYCNMTVIEADRQDIIQYLQTNHCKAYISETVDGKTVIYAEEFLLQEYDELYRFAVDLSTRLDCGVLMTNNYDDDVLTIRLYYQGETVFDFNSAPGIYEGRDDPPFYVGIEPLISFLHAECTKAKLLPLLDPQFNRNKEDEIFLFAVDQHQVLSQMLGLPMCAVGAGYEYIAEDLEEMEKFCGTVFTLIE